MNLIIIDKDELEKSGLANKIVEQMGYLEIMDLETSLKNRTNLIKLIKRQNERRRKVV